jgi:hypothetical protein
VSAGTETGKRIGVKSNAKRSISLSIKIMRVNFVSCVAPHVLALLCTLLILCRLVTIVIAIVGLVAEMSP